MVDGGYSLQISEVMRKLYVLVVTACRMQIYLASWGLYQPDKRGLCSALQFSKGGREESPSLVLRTHSDIDIRYLFSLPFISLYQHLLHLVSASKFFSPASSLVKKRKYFSLRYYCCCYKTYSYI